LPSLILHWAWFLLPEIKGSGTDSGLSDMLSVKLGIASWQSNCRGNSSPQIEPRQPRKTDRFQDLNGELENEGMPVASGRIDHALECQN
jgi:hypothetical protein